MAEVKTIDDLFEQMDHYESRGSVIVVNHPVVKDMTEAVLEEKSVFTHDPELPEGTRYFGFFDPNMLDVTYITASSRTSYHREKSMEAEHAEIQEKRRGPFDKVSQRELCDKIGIFANPRYLDVRKLFTDPYDKIVFRFVPQSFTDFPYDIIVSNLDQFPRSYIFHNMVDGFRVRNSKKGSFTISGNRDVVKEADAETRKIMDPRQRLEAFLEKLVEKGFSLGAVGRCKEEDYSQQNDLVKGILSHKGDLYIKDARTGGGYLVVRVRKEGQDIRIESDSPDFTSLMERREERLKNRQATYDRLVKLNAQQIILDHHQKRIDEYKPKDPRGILYDLFSILRDPIIEEEIPYETLGSHRAEIRLICQRLPMPKAKAEKFEVVGYAKVSGNKVSANISLGGHGETIQDILRGIYSQRMPEITESDLSSIVEGTERDIMRRAQDFAEKVYLHYASDPTLRKTGVEAPRDFAIDLIPRWNDEARKLDFYFLEVNHRYGYTGLQNVNKADAARVLRNQLLIQENKKDRV